jgi:hypothetical protein
MVALTASMRESIWASSPDVNLDGLIDCLARVPVMRSAMGTVPPR